MAIFLSTDNADRHPPEKWALATAEEICPIDRALSGERRVAAEKLQAAITQALLPHHVNVQKHEQDKLSADINHIATPFPVEQYFDHVVADVQAAAAGTPWQDHYNDPEVIATIKQVVGSHFATAQHLERMVAVKNNPDHELSKSYAARYNPEVLLNAATN